MCEPAPGNTSYTLDDNKLPYLWCVLHFRRIDQVFTGTRWFDIKRWRIGKQCLDGYVLGARFINNNTENIRLDKYIFDENRDYLWSVPQTQMDINPNLMPNNPGYNR